MGFKYTIKSNALHFLTFTVVDWVDVFTRRIYKDILLDSLKYCQKSKGLELYAWVIMTNHVHLIAAASSPTPSLSDTVRDLKKFTSKALVKAISEENESRKKWMLDKFCYKGSIHPKIGSYQFWQEGFHPVELINNAIIEQKLEYLHRNPVEAGFVARPEDYLYSSAIDYAGG